MFSNADANRFSPLNANKTAGKLFGEGVLREIFTPRA
jgi:hypothetical protein